MSCVQEHNFCRPRGDTFPFTLQLKDAATNLPVDITGTTFLFTVDPSSEPVGAGANLFQISGVIVSGPNGTVSFTLSSGNANQTPGTYYYDVQWTNGASVRTILRGEWRVEQDVTK